MYGCESWTIKKAESQRIDALWCWKKLFRVQLSYPYTEKGMAPHSSTLAWKIPWMEELGRLQSLGSRRVGQKAECRRIDAFELWCRRRLLRVPWTVRRSNQSILKEISPEYSLEGLIWSWNSNTLAIWCKEPTHWKRPWYWERLKAGGERDNRKWDG